MTIYTNRRLVVGVVCFLMNLSGLAAAQAPQTPETFYELVEGRQMDVTVEELLPILFIAPGRHSTRLERSFSDGNYDYESTGAATGTLMLKFDFDNNTQPVFEIELTFESRTAGTVLATFFREDGTVEGENVPGIFEIVDAIVPEPTSAEDRAALMALYDATNGASWSYSTNWGSSRPLGEWYGVTTDPYGNVTELELHTNELTGEIPGALGSMTNLAELNLAYNGLTGEIPAALGSLTNLTLLDLSYNRLTGEIPAALARFENTINPQQGGVYLPVASTPVPALPLAGLLLLGALSTLAGVSRLRRGGSLARGPSHQHRG